MENSMIEKILQETNPNDYDKDLMLKVVKDSIAFVKNNGLDNVAIAFEELAELEQVITKEIRGKGNKLDAIEEICDVLLGMEFLNAVYGIEIDTSIKYSRTEETSLFVILKQLVVLQEQILDAILLEDIGGLKNACLEVMHSIETLKEYFGINNEDITKMKIFKINRLKERMDNKTLI